MAGPVRVVFRIMFGDPGRRASPEEKKKGLARWNEIQEEWRADPGIRFCCYYWTPGRSLDGYSHHYVFEVDDLDKVQKMNGPISMGEVYPFEKYSFEIVFANEKVDEFWAS